MKSISFVKIFVACLVVICFWVSGCGGSSSTNVISVAISDALQGVVVVTQSDTITATVTGPDTVNGVADPNVTFSCTYTTTTITNGTTKTATPIDCATAGAVIGTFSNVQPTTEIYTAPAQLPDQTKFPNLVLTVTATSTADTKRKNSLTLQINSGIVVSVLPTSATLALGEQKLFTATIGAGVSGSVTWGVTNTTVNTGGTPPIDGTFTLTTPTCTDTSAGAKDNCGSIDQNGNFTAPKTLPTNTNVIIFAIANQDTNRVGIANVTLVTGGSVTFNSLWPTVVPQGASQADIFLNATNLTSQIGITLNGTAIDASAAKVFFTPSSLSATTGPVSTGARLRLTAEQLKTPGTFTVAIAPGVSQTTPIATHTFQVVPVRPGLVASFPANIAEGLANQNVAIDGGYYGPAGAAIVGVNFNGNVVATKAAPNGDPRRIVGTIASTGSVAGLLPVNVTNTLDVANPSTVYSNVAVLPNYANASNPASLPSSALDNTLFPPCVQGATGCVGDLNGNFPFQLCVPSGTVTCSYPKTISLGANSQPSAIAVDPIIGYAAVTEAATNTVQFLNLSANPLTPSAAFPTGNPAAGNLPTGVAIDHHVCTHGGAGSCSQFQDIVAVTNFQARTLAVLSVPTGTLLETIPLNNLIPPSGGTGTNMNPSPNPFSVGIDPFTHRALVAFASTNAGFVVNLDQSQSPSICLPGFAPADGSSYCPVAFVTLNTGTNPHIAFEPGAHLAYVTPGGAGQITAVSLSTPSAGPLKIASATRTGNTNIVTIQMAPNTPHNIVPGDTPTVLISGLPPGTAGTSFNGAFPVLSVIDNLHFTYVQNGPADVSTSTAGQQGFLSFGTNAITYNVTPTVQGIDINPISHSVVLADPNNAGPASGGAQVTFINSLNQTPTALALCGEKNLAVVIPSTPCTPELGIASVAFQPFTNTVVSLRYDMNNGFDNQISLLDPSSSQRVTIVPTGQMAFATTNFTAPGAVAPVQLTGAIAVDPIHNLALAVNSGSGTITPLFLGTIKSLQIESIATPPVDAADGAVNPATIAQSVLINSTSLPSSISGIQIFGRGFDASSAVRLDGVPLPATGTPIFNAAKPNELDITIPATNGTQKILTGPRNFGLDVVNGDGSTSNVMDFRVVEAIPLPQCAGVNAAPGGVAIANDLLGTTKNYAVVTELGCKQVAKISLNKDNTFATFTTIPTGGSPTGIATIPRFGYAVVSNEADGTASILNLMTDMQVVTNVTTGSGPEGVAIEQETGLAVIANEGSNTATVIDLTPLQATPVGTLAPLTVATDQEPIAVAIDPDRGANATGLAVITALSISSSPAQAVLDSVDLSIAVPAKNSLATVSVGTIPTGIIFDPAAVPAPVFYATESDSNAFVAFNPDVVNGTSSIQVGINPFAVAYNPQTSSILTVNSTSNSISIIDSLTFQTQATLGLGSVSLFSAAIEPFSNVAVIADQTNNRVLLFPLPH